MMRRAGILALASLALLAANAPDTSLGPDPYLGLDGAADARADMIHGRPLKLLSHLQNGHSPGYATPGLSGCEPSGKADFDSEGLFEELPEADWQEGVRYSAAQRSRAASALRFARAYNRAFFTARRAVIRQVCPNAKLAD